MSRLLHSLPRAAGGRKMDSIVREVVSRSGVQPRLPESPTQRVGVDAEDAELERILASLRTNIKIVGIGGGGCNTIDRLVESGIVGAELFAANTDAQHLLIIRSPHKLLLGRRVTRGLGAGALPQVGEESAREAADELRSVVQGADMVFITCGLGGGTRRGDQLAPDRRRHQRRDRSPGERHGRERHERGRGGEGRRDRPGSDRPERPDHLGSGGRPEPGAQAAGHAHPDRRAIEADPRAGRARAYPRRRRHRTVRLMADIVDKSWEVQRRIEERAKRLGKGRYGRVLKMARRPTPDEYSKVVLITGLGIAAIGALGFVIYLIMRYGPGVFHGIFGSLGL